MPVPFEGGCLCGAVRYRVTREPIKMMICHCRNCQKQTASDRSPVMWVPADGFEIFKGTPRYLEVVAESGNRQKRHFCGDCGSPLYTQPEHLPHIRTIKAGTIDDQSWLRPEAHIWTSSTAPWAPITDDLPRHPGNLIAD
jgi:hypothetical protein